MSAPIKMTSGTTKVAFPALISVIYVDNRVPIPKQRITAKEFVVYYIRFFEILNENENTMNLTVTKYERSNDLCRKFCGMI